MKHGGLIALWLMWATPLFAADWQIHGFASQGYLDSSGNSFYGASKPAAWRLREGGVNLSWRPTPRLLFATQGLLRQAGEHDIPPAALDYLFLDLTLSASLAHQTDLLVGRVKLPFGFYNETRDVAVTRPSILLPQSIYFDRTRDLALSADGLLWMGWREQREGRWTVKFGVMRPRVGSGEVEYALFNQDVPGRLEPGILMIGKLQYNAPSRGWRAAFSALRAEASYPGTSGFPAGEVRFLPVILSLAMERERFGVTGEFAWRGVDYLGFPGTAFEGLGMTGESYYLQGIWYLTSRLQVLIRYDRLVVDRSDPQGSRYAAQTGEAAHTRFAMDWTVGMSLALSKDWRFQLERHEIDGTAWLTSRDRSQGALVRRWGLWVAMLAYRF